MNRLSERLETIIAMVPADETACVADVGTDHGFVPIRLVLEKKAAGALALDVRQGPLARAGEHIRQAGLSDRIETRLGDGLASVSPGEADGVVIAGMGGALMLRILRESGAHLRTVRWWVLSPQSELSAFRHGLEELGLAVRDERMLCEDGKYYVVLLAGPGSMHYEREYQYRYGDCLIRSGSPALGACLERERRQLISVLSGLSRETGAAAARRAEELKKELAILEEAKNAYDALQRNHTGAGSSGSAVPGHELGQSRLSGGESR